MDAETFWGLVAAHREELLGMIAHRRRIWPRSWDYCEDALSQALFKTFRLRAKLTPENILWHVCQASLDILANERVRDVRFLRYAALSYRSHNEHLAHRVELNHDLTWYLSQLTAAQRTAVLAVANGEHEGLSRHGRAQNRVHNLTRKARRRLQPIVRAEAKV